MGKVVVFINVTLDGVMQSPAGPDEDQRGNFEHGGWAAPYTAMQEVGDNKSATGAILFGRWTYENFYAYWPHQTNNPYTEILNSTQKYVVSTTLKEPLTWQNSTLLKGNAIENVTRLKEELNVGLLVLGSGMLVQSLMQHNLIDEYVLLIHPLILGSGRHLFPDGGKPATFELVKTKKTAKGVIIATYQPA